MRKIHVGNHPEQSNMEGSDGSEDKGYYVFSASDDDSNTSHLMIKNEPVGVITDPGATCTYNLMTEPVFDKMYKGKLELLKTDRKV